MEVRGRGMETALPVYLPCQSEVTQQQCQEIRSVRKVKRGLKSRGGKGLWTAQRRAMILACRGVGRGRG